jgi:hypothetical protein
MLHVPVVTSSTSCSADSDEAISQARIAGPAMRAPSGSPVTIAMRRRRENRCSMSNAATIA